MARPNLAGCAGVQRGEPGKLAAIERRGRAGAVGQLEFELVEIEGRIDDADGAGINVRSDDLIETTRNENHVRAILARAENPIHTLAARIVTSHNFVRLRREVKLAAGKSRRGPE